MSVWMVLRFCFWLSVVLEGMLVVKFVLLNGVCFMSLGVGGRRVSEWRGWCWCCALCRSIDECSLQCWCIGSISVSSCRCCMLVSAVHPVAVRSAAFCTVCSLVVKLGFIIGP